MQWIKLHKGFTLAELMVCLAIISIIATLLMPAIGKLRPNKNKVMFKKAYYLTERIISEMINDEDMYPTVDGLVGFDNSTASVTINGVSYVGNTKFCKLFALKVNTLEDSASVNCATTASFGNPSFTTTDGVEWILPIDSFISPDTAVDTKYYSIQIDVNGDETPPNCVDGDATCSKPDRYIIQFRADGKMRVTTPHAKEYLGTTNMIDNQ